MVAAIADVTMQRRAQASKALAALMLLLLAGCGAAAAPCRVASAGIKIIPLVGSLAATPTDACAGAIDP